MKKIMFSLGLFLLAFVANAQSDMYKSGMKSLIAKLESAGQSAEAYQEISNGFVRIGDAEKKEWLPKYYAAYGAIMSAMFTKDKTQVDGILDQADKLLSEASAMLASDEIMCLQAFSKSTRINVDPMARGMKYGMESAKLLAGAKAMNANNPRIYFLQGQSAFYTPEQFGGGKKIALTLFQTALEKYESNKPKDELMPNWGQEMTSYMIAECAK